MKIIAHRGNLNGPTSNENSLKSIDNVLNTDFDIEIDVWVKDNKIWLGHDQPDTLLSPTVLYANSSKFWIHCKNKEALLYFSEIDEFNYLYHHADDYTLTSKKYIWVYPNKPLIKRSICVMPEYGINGDINVCSGLCTDYPLKYKDEYK
tara:strand:- start:2544 stop:2990 length:447 start_codon:yes stop_codon:yes gene_type:complete